MKQKGATARTPHVEGYADFLTRKAIIDLPTGIKNPKGISESLFAFQAPIVEWALKRGRAAIFAGTGLGKTPKQCEWSRLVERHTKRPVLIVAPLAVSHQTICEARKILGMDIAFASGRNDIGKRGVYVTNYQKIHNFDASVFSGVALDESSILKSQDGATRTALIEAFALTPFRLACSATPAPNDFVELGNHSEFLGVMRMTEMLSTFFVHDGGDTSQWRLKGHAENDFWKWVSSWAVYITKPSDIGFSDEGYILPPLRVHEVIVDCDSTPLEGELFAMPAKTMQERRGARKVSIEERIEAAKEIAQKHQGEQILTWCGLNEESEKVSKAIGAVNVTGSDPDEKKEKDLLGFASGQIERMTSKVAIAGFGLNLQGCHVMIFLGLSDSWEALFQAVRRCWRFGQKHPVDVYIIISSLEIAVLENIKRKEADAEKMQKSLASHMAEFTKRQISTRSTVRDHVEYYPIETMKLPDFL